MNKMVDSCLFKVDKERSSTTVASEKILASHPPMSHQMYMVASVWARSVLSCPWKQRAFVYLMMRCEETCLAE